MKRRLKKRKSRTTVMKRRERDRTQNRLSLGKQQVDTRWAASRGTQVAVDGVWSYLSDAYLILRARTPQRRLLSRCQRNRTRALSPRKPTKKNCVIVCPQSTCTPGQPEHIPATGVTLTLLFIGVNKWCRSWKNIQRCLHSWTPVETHRMTQLVPKKNKQKMKYLYMWILSYVSNNYIIKMYHRKVMKMSWIITHYHLI